MTRAVFAALAVLALVIGSRTARADAIDLSVESPALYGKAQPALVLRVNEPVEAMSVRLSGSPRVVVTRSFEDVRPGTELRVEVPVPRPGTYALTGELKVRFADGGTGQLPLDFQVMSLAQLEFRTDATPEGVEQGRLTVRALDDAPLERYQLALYGRDPSPLLEDQGPVGPGGEISWSPPEGQVLRAVLTVHDEAGRYREVTLYPWRVDVPHEEVHFPTGSADIPETEAAKLEATLHKLNATLADYGRWAPVKLYIAGHTDTVGTAASNLPLSQRRARSIASWFRAHGVDVPIFFAGFGESQLERATPDETESAENRRAEYIVAVDPPPLPAGAPGWSRVP